MVIILMDYITLCDKAFYRVLWVHTNNMSFVKSI